MTMKLLLVRRAEIDQVGSVATDSPALSTTGESQLSALVEQLRSRSIGAVVTSEMPRAIATARQLSEMLAVPMIRQSGLHERDFGDWDSWEWPDIAAKLDPLSVEERYEFVPPSGESWKQMDQRLSEAFDSIREMPYDSVAVVTHWGPIRALIPMLSRQSKESTLQLTVDNGQLFELSIGRDVDGVAR